MHNLYWANDASCLHLQKCDVVKDSFEAIILRSVDFEVAVLDVHCHSVAVEDLVVALEGSAMPFPRAVRNLELEWVDWHCAVFVLLKTTKRKFVLK